MVTFTSSPSSDLAVCTILIDGITSSSSTTSSITIDAGIIIFGITIIIIHNLVQCLAEHRHCCVDNL